jgi:hypothetical protein
MINPQNKHNPVSKFEKGNKISSSHHNENGA